MKLKMYEQRNLRPILKLKGLRAERAVTQSEIANILGISTATYNRKENGLGQFDMREINIITRFFGLTYEEIFGMGEVS